jgi:hypothetical protein
VPQIEAQLCLTRYHPFVRRAYACAQFFVVWSLLGPSAPPAPKTLGEFQAGKSLGNEKVVIKDLWQKYFSHEDAVPWPEFAVHLLVHKSGCALERDGPVALLCASLQCRQPKGNERKANHEEAVTRGKANPGPTPTPAQRRGRVSSTDAVGL